MTKVNKDKLKQELVKLDRLIDECDIGRNYWCSMTRLTHQSMVSRRANIKSELSSASDKKESEGF